MEHLFKLKKDGKTVGYSHINGYGQLMFRLPNEDDWWCKDKFWELMRKKYGFGIPPCSYHTFVTKDKNGKDIFAGDKIKMFSKQYKVIWDERELGWYLQDEYKAKIKLSNSNKNNIEFIEDKEDD